MRMISLLYVMAHTQKDQDGKLSMKTIAPLRQSSKLKVYFLIKRILALVVEEITIKVTGIDP